jgi:opacity protein-like surface antigen
MQSPLPIGGRSAYFFFLRKLLIAMSCNDLAQIHVRQSVCFDCCSHKEAVLVKRSLLFFSVLIILSLSCWAQEEPRHQLTLQGSGFLGKTTTSSGVQSEPTNSGGFLAGYRFNINNWIAAEVDYDFFSNSQRYATSSGNFRKQTYTHGITGAGVLKLPAFHGINTFALAGGGAMVFHPRNSTGIESQSRGTFVYGGGADVPLIKHVALRAQYRGFVYKVPDFNVNQLKADKFTHAAVPSAGFVFKF